MQIPSGRLNLKELAGDTLLYPVLPPDAAKEKGAEPESLTFKTTTRGPTTKGVAGQGLGSPGPSKDVSVRVASHASEAAGCDLHELRSNKKPWPIDRPTSPEIVLTNSSWLPLQQWNTNHV